MQVSSINLRDLKKKDTSPLEVLKTLNRLESLLQKGLNLFEIIEMYLFWINKI